MTRRCTLILALLAVSLPLLASAAPVAAATITISDDASCTAAGGTVPASNQCLFPYLAVLSGDTLTIAGGTELYVREDISIMPGATLNLNSALPATMAGAVVNEGTINITSSRGLDLLSRFAQQAENHGTIVVKTRLYLERTGLDNSGTITVPCGGRIIAVRSSIQGTPPVYACPPSNDSAVTPLPENEVDATDR